MTLIVKGSQDGGGEIAQWIRAFAIKHKDLSEHSTHMKMQAWASKFAHLVVGAETDALLGLKSSRFSERAVSKE